MIELISSPEAWISLGVLTLMEIVLGIDNVVFITILCSRLPRHQQVLGRRLGLGAALLTRVLLLLTLNWLAHLEDVLFTVVRAWTGKDLVLACGGLFLLWKATREIYDSVEHPEDPDAAAAPDAAGMLRILVQIMVLDIVFSLDSVITAVGMADHVEVMVTAILLSVVVMMVFAGPVGDFVERNPSVRVLALSFLVLIGVTLIMEGTGAHVEKAYIYSAMGFSLVVQVLNLRMSKRQRQLAKRLP